MNNTTVTEDTQMCQDCGHTTHNGVPNDESQRLATDGCRGWVDNGWTQHGCHCKAGPIVGRLDIPARAEAAASR